MKALLIGDVHLSDQPPSLRTDTYTDDILAKIEQAVRIAAAHHCEAIIQAGDVFHIKAPARNSHSLVQRTHEALTSQGIPVLIVPGNHDLSNDRMESLQKQPLGTLAKMPGVDLLVGPHDRFPFFGLPYLHDWSLFPEWVRRYRTWADEQKAQDFEFMPLLVTHAPLFPEGDEPPYDYISAPDWARQMEKGDCYYGHIHDPHGAYVPVKELPVAMCNNGAISRGSLHEKTLKREPAVTIWDSEKSGTARFERVALEVRPVEAVFKMSEKEDIDTKTERVEAFLESVGQTSLPVLSLEEVAHQAKERGLSDQTLSLIEDLLREA